MKDSYWLLCLYSACILLVFAACESKDKISDSNLKKMQSDFPPPPKAKEVPITFTQFGIERVDDFFYMKDKTNADVLAYLKAENAYSDTVMQHTKAIQETMYVEMKGRIKEEDSSVPTLENGYYYYYRTVAGKQYRVECRKKGSVDAPEEIVVDFNKMAEGFPAFITSRTAVTRNNEIVAISYNTTGSYAEYDLRFKNLNTGEFLEDQIKNIQGFSLANDSKTVFYTVGDKALRAYRVYRHELGKKKPDVLVFEDKDPLFNLDLYKTKTDSFIVMISGSFTTTECWLINANKPTAKPKLFAKRAKDVDYRIHHHESKFFVHVKDPESPNYRIMQAPLTRHENKETWKEVVPHDPNVKIENIEVFNRFLSYVVRQDGLKELRVMDFATNVVNKVNFPEPVYTMYTLNTPEYLSYTLRYGYASLNRPSSVFEYSMTENKSTLLKELEIPTGFNPDHYAVERLWAPAKDGTRIPMAIVYKKGLKKGGTNPTLLYAYGSYGAPTDANFNANAFSLIDRGYIYALAQIRGGSDLGEQWYDNGKLMKKMNTFTDFIACAEHLIDQKYTNPEKLGAMGGSAGGLLMGVVANMRPDLFQAVLALVPFVDVINTMLDTNLPLTTQEYEQWGNPNEEEAFKYIYSYSPYDNVKAQNYPNILATGGINDSQVGFHEPTKWVAKLRKTKTDNNLTLLKINMDSGHGGATGRFDRLKDVAYYYAFLIDRLK